MEKLLLFKEMNYDTRQDKFCGNFLSVNILRMERERFTGNLPHITEISTASIY